MVDFHWLVLDLKKKKNPSIYHAKPKLQREFHWFPDTRPWPCLAMFLGKTKNAYIYICCYHGCQSRTQRTASIMADAMCLQPDRCLRCDLWGLHAHWVSSTFHRCPVRFGSGISFKDQFDTQGTFLREFGVRLFSEAAWICLDALSTRSPGTLVDLYRSIFWNLVFFSMNICENLNFYINNDSSLSVV